MNRKRFQSQSRLLRATILAILAAFALAACGQRGPLYLPDEDKSVQEDSQADEDEASDDDAPPLQP